MGNNPSTTTKTWDEMFEIALAKLFAETFQVCQFCVGKCFRQPQQQIQTKNKNSNKSLRENGVEIVRTIICSVKNKKKSILLLLNTDNVICNL